MKKTSQYSNCSLSSLGSQCDALTIYQYMLGDLAAYSFSLSNKESEDVLFLQLLASKNACVYQGKRARLPLRVHLCMSMFLHRGKFSSLNSFPEEQCLVYWSSISTTPIWESGGLPPENYS